MQFGRLKLDGLKTGKLKELISSSRALRITLLAGLMFLVLAGIALTIFFLIERSSTKVTRAQDNFIRSLHQYDMQLMEAGSQKEFDRLSRELDKIENMAVSVESWLSVLKRRRILAKFNPSSFENYRKSVTKAITAFPMSQPITAIAAEALIKDSAINREDELQLRSWLAELTEHSFNSLRLSLHILLGDFRDPGRAVSIISDDLYSDGTQDVTIDLAILKILREDIQGAASDVQTMLQTVPLSDSILRVAGEFNYDFGDLVRSAEIFSFINDEKALIRQADALYLADFQESARAIWTLLADSNKPIERSIYNLGVTSEDSEESFYWYEKLIHLDTEEVTDSRQYGLIRYSRLLETEKALPLLRSIENLQPASNPFVDLEICRREAAGWELGRQIAEAWLLLDRHDDYEDLYKWAAWLFLYQRNYSETKIILKRMEQLNYTGQWALIDRAVQLMFDGNINEAEDILRSIPAEDAGWAVFANLGRILEARHSTGAAVEQYEAAAERAENPKVTARLLVRVAKCYSALNRPSEALRALLTATELDPENLSAKLELDRASYLLY